MYYKPNTNQFKEFTMIGKTLTELFRLESISVNNAINYYWDSNFCQYTRNLGIKTATHPDHYYKWLYIPYPSMISLKGVDYSYTRHQRYNAEGIY
jgi:hypothetical protein